MLAVNSLEEIKIEIEKLRENLCELLKNTEKFNSTKVLEISRDLDKLIVVYFEMNN